MKKFPYFNIRRFNLKFIILASPIIIIITVYVRSTPTLFQEFFFVSRSSITGEASVIDGDSIVISSIMIRLSGIDSPEIHQFCGTKKTRYPCGLEAKKYLERLIAHQPVTCYWRKKDKYHRILATCRTKKINNINAAIVQNGWAVSYYDYPEEEEKAKKEKKGIWQSNFQKPNIWRKAHSQIQ
ncbi:thermonuclease family protein [Bartonella sp. B10]